MDTIRANRCRTVGRLVALTIMVAAISGCPAIDKKDPGEPTQPTEPTGPDKVALRETEDPSNLIHQAQIEDGKAVRYRAIEVPKDAFSNKRMLAGCERSPRRGIPLAITRMTTSTSTPRRRIKYSFDSSGHRG